MPSLPIRFYSLADNSPTVAQKTTKHQSLTGYISAKGNVVLPNKTVEQLAIDPDLSRFLVGAAQGKRNVKELYLVPATDDDPAAFALIKGAKSYALALGGILLKSGIDYKTSKYQLVINPFEYEEGITAYALRLEPQTTSDVVPGKRRGRKPKAAADQE